MRIGWAVLVCCGCTPTGVAILASGEAESEVVRLDESNPEFRFELNATLATSELPPGVDWYDTHLVEVDWRPTEEESFISVAWQPCLEETNFPGEIWTVLQGPQQFAHGAMFGECEPPDTCTATTCLVLTGGEVSVPLNFTYAVDVRTGSKVIRPDAVQAAAMEVSITDVTVREQ